MNLLSRLKAPRPAHLALAAIVLTVLYAGAVPAQPAFAANLAVTTLLDNEVNDGVCSLREAIIAANQDSNYFGCTGMGYGDDTITFSVAGTVTLTSSLPGVDDPQDDGLTIDGDDAIVVDGASLYRPFRATSDLTLIDLVVRNGLGGATGGGILVDGSTVTIIGSEIGPGNSALSGAGIGNNAGDLILDDTSVHDNVANTGDGGGIYINGGSVTLINGSAVEDNTARDGGGILNAGGTLEILDGSSVSGNDASESGGGIYSYLGGEVTVEDSQINSNEAEDSGGGIFSDGGTVDVANSDVNLNIAGNVGGGILATNGAEVTVTDSTSINGNDGFDGGGIYNVGSSVVIEDSLLSGNDAAPGSGGGINVIGAGASLEITSSTLSQNTAASNGGAIISSGGLAEVTITGTTIGPDNTTGSDGGGIYNQDTDVTLIDSTVTGNTAASNGGGINNESGTVSLTRTTVSDNTVTGSNGGGIDNETGTLTLVDSTVSGNTTGSNGGGIYTSTNSETTLTGSTVTDNDAGGDGGGIRSVGTLTIIDSTIGPDNTAGDDGGGIYKASGVLMITDSGVSDNDATGQGGGLYNDGGEVMITGSTIAGNEAFDDGGGINNLDGGSVTILASLIDGNETTEGVGGGIFSGPGSVLEVSDSTVSDNLATYLSARSGGGIYNAGDGTVLNSTITGNEANWGGGYYGNFSSDGVLANTTISGNTATANGGGAYIDEGIVSLINVTITGNTGDGIYRGAALVVDVVNTIIADQLSGPDCNLPVNSGGNNLDSDGTCGLTEGGDISSGDANLGPLADNGGPTETHALLSGSDAIDNGDDDACDDEPVDGRDQRGVLRPQGPDCDIGAFERLLELEITVEKVASATSIPEFGQSVTYTVTVTNNTDNEITLLELTDDQFGDLDGEGSCVADGSVTIAAGEAYECSFTEFVLGPAGSSHVNIVTASVSDFEENVASASGSESVLFVPPQTRPNIGAGLSGLFQGQPTPLPGAVATAPQVITPPSTGDAGLR